MSLRIGLVLDDDLLVALDQFVDRMNSGMTATTRSKVIRRCVEYGLRNPDTVGLIPLTVMAAQPQIQMPPGGPAPLFAPQPVHTPPPAPVAPTRFQENVPSMFSGPPKSIKPVRAAPAVAPPFDNPTDIEPITLKNSVGRPVVYFDYDQVRGLLEFQDEAFEAMAWNDPETPDENDMREHGKRLYLTFEGVRKAAMLSKISPHLVNALMVWAEFQALNP